MAKVDVVIRCACCGKEFVRSGTVMKSSDREGFAAWARKNITICPACYAAQKKNEAATAAAEFDLPALTGSEKQKAWAETIRNATVKKMTEIRSRYVGAEENFTKAIKYVIASHADAAYWIDNRDATERELTEMLAKAFDDANA